MPDMAKPALHQMLALQGPKRNEMDAVIARNFTLLADPKNFKGQEQSYTAYEDGDRDIPKTQNEPVQYKAREVIEGLIDHIAPPLDIMYTVEQGNAQASAAIMINGQPLLKTADGKPLKLNVTMLLRLEKTVKNILERAKLIAVMDLGHKWEFDATQGCYATQPIKTIRQRKSKVVLKKAEATTQHPAQTEVYDNDVPVGEYTTRFFTGALSRAEKYALIERLQELFDAIVVARHEANMQPVEQLKVGEDLLRWAFEPVLTGQNGQQQAT